MSETNEISEADRRLLPTTTCSRVVDYIIAREYIYQPDYMGGRLATFDDRVRELIAEGWQPIGGPFVDRSGTAQAMVKYAAISSANK
jgi:Domain of unknown function (DUF1737)